jgi:hypothetical protein
LELSFDIRIKVGLNASTNWVISNVLNFTSCIYSSKILHFRPGFFHPEHLLDYESMTWKSELRRHTLFCIDVSTGPGILAAVLDAAADGVPGLTDADILDVVTMFLELCIEEVKGRSIRLRDIDQGV